MKQKLQIFFLSLSLKVAGMVLITIVRYLQKVDRESRVASLLKDRWDLLPFRFEDISLAESKDSDHLWKATYRKVGRSPRKSK